MRERAGRREEGREERCSWVETFHRNAFTITAPVIQNAVEQIWTLFLKWWALIYRHAPILPIPYRHGVFLRTPSALWSVTRYRPMRLFGNIFALTQAPPPLTIPQRQRPQHCGSCCFGLMIFHHSKQDGSPNVIRPPAFNHKSDTFHMISRAPLTLFLCRVNCVTSESDHWVAVNAQQSIENRTKHRANHRACYLSISKLFFLSQPNSLDYAWLQSISFGRKNVEYGDSLGAISIYKANEFLHSARMREGNKWNQEGGALLCGKFFVHTLKHSFAHEKSHRSPLPSPSRPLIWTTMGGGAWRAKLLNDVGVNRSNDKCGGNCMAYSQFRSLCSEDVSLIGALRCRFTAKDPPRIRKWVEETLLSVPIGPEQVKITLAFISESSPLP